MRARQGKLFPLAAEIPPPRRRPLFPSCATNLEKTIMQHPSLAGYAAEAEKLIKDYESRPFEIIFAPFLHVFPSFPSRILDIGAGTGRHAAALARQGHAVVAVEPTKELREAGKKLHSDAGIVWIDDVLPELDALRNSNAAGPYDCVLMAAVMMHFDAEEREAVMRRAAELIAPGGRFIATYRRGPVPEGRRMFDIDPKEATALGERHGFELVAEAISGDAGNRAGVSWSMLCLDKKRG